MGILGMMAAGGAVGLADASNKQVAAQQQMEMEGMRADRVDKREALRQQYLDRNFNIERQDKKDNARAQMQMEELKYNRTRADKLTDSEMTHKQKLELTGLAESGKDRRSAASIAAANKRAEARIAATGGGAAGGGGARSSQGKLIEDMISMGIAKDPTEAYNLATRSDVLRAALQNPLAQISSDTLIDEVSKLVEGLGPTRRGGGLLTGGNAPSVPEISFALDPKTGKLVPNGR